MLEELATQAFWIGLLKIIGVNIVLSGDNAVVIALAARSLPPKQQKLAIFWGAGAAVVLRIVLTVFAVALLALPWLKIIGGLLLFWIGVKLLVPEDGGDDIDASDNLIAAIKTILIADLVMSIDNVIAVAAAAQGSYVLLVLGLAISIPLVMFGATLLRAPDGALSRHHHDRRGPDRLRRRRDAGHGPGAGGLDGAIRHPVQRRQPDDRGAQAGDRLPGRSARCSWCCGAHGLPSGRKPRNAGAGFCELLTRVKV